MSNPQPGIFLASQPHQYVLEYDILDGQDTEAVISALRHVRKFFKGMPEEISHVISFGPALYRCLAGERTPTNLNSFETIVGSDGKTAPASQRDVLVWLQGPFRDVLFDMAMKTDHVLGAVASCGLELSGFIYHDSRDLTGFIDGSANPTGDLVSQTALVPEGETGAGGAHMLTQKWVHNLDAFNSLPVDDQERVIGRTKAESIELEGDAMPANSHVSRTDAKIDGAAQRLYRRSFPYGSVSEHGLYFLAFSCDPGRFDLLLRRMFGVSGDGLVDSLTDFSTAVSGAYWFAPSCEDLDAITRV